MAPLSNNTELTERKRVLEDLPVHDKNNFRIYHEQSGDNKFKKSLTINQRSIYPTTPDVSAELRIVNQPKPEPTLRYLKSRVEGKEEDKNKRKKNSR